MYPAFIAASVTKVSQEKKNLTYFVGGVPFYATINFADSCFHVMSGVWVQKMRFTDGYFYRCFNFFKFRAIHIAYSY